MDATIATSTFYKKRRPLGVLQDAPQCKRLKKSDSTKQPLGKSSDEAMKSMKFDKSIQTDPQVPMELRLEIGQFSPIEYWMLTVKDRKADIKRARSEISALCEQVGHLKQALEEKKTIERNAEYFEFMYNVTS